MTFHGTFEIATPEEYFEKIVLRTYLETKEPQNKCSSAAFLIATTFAYHFIDWRYSSKKSEKKDDGIGMIKRVLDGIATNEEIDYFDVARQIANGTKHFKRSDGAPNDDRAKTAVVNPFSDEFTDEFGPTLLIDITRSDGSGTEKVTARDFLEKLLIFWRGQMP
ncbi:hypothetical protein SAE02_63000 [Skermanella aerolata]|uniref:Uncharacterized protein n=1 Tax=Skermanella aerolata TaxID=393310 RepID=A0A512E0B4_9PROT|nr:hypothetical protein [Skermanella aerolata]KJB91352.1 hypothetical protein N826_30795 [Skermanella aerolata KACC 11604]GEO42152.1 hypothetical protein SAE02_63000 [Skermanella aerolata]